MKLPLALWGRSPEPQTYGPITVLPSEFRGRSYQKRKPWRRSLAFDERLLGRAHGVLYALARDGRIGGKTAVLFGCLVCGALHRRRYDIRITTMRHCYECRPSTIARLFSDETVREMRRLRRETRLTVKEIGARFGAKKHTTYCILARRSYRNVDDGPCALAPALPGANTNEPRVTRDDDDQEPADDY